MKQRLITAALSACLAVAAQAAPAKGSNVKQCKHAYQPTATNWNVKVGLGYSAYTGNVVNTNGHASLHTDYSPKLWQYILDLNAQVLTRNRERKQERYFEGFQARYHYKPSENYTYGLVQATQDAFATYNRVVIGSAGYGWTLLDNCNWYLLWQLGPGVRYEHVTGTNIKETRAIVHSQAELSWFLSTNTTAKEKLVLESNKQNTYWQSTTSLETKMIHDFAFKLSFMVGYNTNVPPESVNTYKMDTTSMVSLVYTFVK